MEKDKNILIIGNYGNYNIGDEILLKVTILELEKNFKNDKKRINISIPVRNPEFINIYHSDIENLNAFHVYDFKKLIKILMKSEKVIVGGGGIWSGYTGRLAKLIPIFLIISKMFGKEIVIKGIGFYNTASNIEKILVNICFIFADQCSVRDIESFNNIWSINKKIKIEKDLALQLPDILKSDDTNSHLYQKYEDLLKETSEYKILCDLRSQNKFIIGISIKPLKDVNKTKEIIEKISNFINFINSRYKDRVHFVFFPFAQTSLDVGIENDMIPINSIINNIKIKNICIISHMNPILWYFLVGFTDIFIGMRFHSIIFAFINNKPFVAIPYENKIWNFIKENNCTNVLPLENFDDKYLIEFVEKELKEKELKGKELKGIGYKTMEKYE